MLNLLRNDFGIKLFPKKDGRVSIPKRLSKLMNDMVYVSYEDDLIFISNGLKGTDNKEKSSLSVSGGKIRVPAKIIESSNMSDKEIIAFFDGEKIILRTNNAYLLKNYITQVEPIKISNSFTILKEELIKCNINCNLNPELFLLSNEENMVFRPIGNPYRFALCWQDGEPKLCENDEDAMIIYAIPGVKRFIDKQYFVGFLLLDEINTGKAKSVLTDNADIIFAPSKQSNIGSFIVCSNPPEDLPANIINEAKVSCADPECFLLEHFDIFEKGECEYPPSELTEESWR